MLKKNLQINYKGKLCHLLSIDGVPKSLLLQILDTADYFISIGIHTRKIIPILRGKIVCNLFFESSTRTRTTFELAAKKLSAYLINFNVSTSSYNKGETLKDTLKNLVAMKVDMFIVRHTNAGVPHFIAEHVVPKNIVVINAGDGRHAHPTQGLIDMFTIRRHKKKFDSISVAIIGDILHSRVARSNIIALDILGCPDIRVIAPRTLLPIGLEKKYNVRIFHNIDEGIKNVDVIIMLRLQIERMQYGLLPSKNEFFKRYGLNEQRLKLANPHAIIMHPGPINRGIEMDSKVADGNQSIILNQVTYSIAVRMAVMSMTIGGGRISI